MPIPRGLLRLERTLHLRLRSIADRKAHRAALRCAKPGQPAHLAVGERGELLAYHHLREQGYTVVARRWQTPRLRGDLDLVAWDGDTLVVVEVKTRTAHDFVPAAFAVDEQKRRMLRRMAQAYKRRLPEPWRDRVPLRFDILSVYLLEAGPEFDLLPNAFASR